MTTPVLLKILFVSAVLRDVSSSHRDYNKTDIQECKALNDAGYNGWPTSCISEIPVNCSKVKAGFNDDKRFEQCIRTLEDDQKLYERGSDRLLPVTIEYACCKNAADYDDPDDAYYTAYYAAADYDDDADDAYYTAYYAADDDADDSDSPLSAVFSSSTSAGELLNPQTPNIP